jgi:hypothetical protein
MNRNLQEILLDINPTRLLMTLNVNGLNIPIKRKIVKVDQKTRPKYTLSRRKLLWINSHIDIKWICYVNPNQKKATVIILILHRANFRVRKVVRDRGTLHNDERSALQENRIILMCAPNNKGSRYVRQKLIELWGQINESTIKIIGRDSNTLYGRKSSKDDSINPLDNGHPLTTSSNSTLNNAWVKELSRFFDILKIFYFKDKKF